jgi:hypothetical protein
LAGGGGRRPARQRGGLGAARQPALYPQAGPTGKTGISSGHTDWSLNGIYSADSSSQALAAVSYNVSKALTLDFGLSHSLRGGVPDRAVFGGLTLLGPKLFQARSAADAA